MITTGSPPKRSRYLLVASYELEDLSTSVSVLVLGSRLVTAMSAPASDSSAAIAIVSSGRLAAAAVMRAKRFSIESGSVSRSRAASGQLTPL
jgi:2-keto-3-deoxy-galactonokinase